MLRNEDDIEENADIAEKQLDGIASYASPIMLKSTVYDKLRDTQHTTERVEQDLSDRPSCR